MLRKHCSARFNNVLCERYEGKVNKQTLLQIQIFDDDIVLLCHWELRARRRFNRDQKIGCLAFCWDQLRLRLDNAAFMGFFM